MDDQYHNQTAILSGGFAFRGKSGKFMNADDFARMNTSEKHIKSADEIAEMYADPAYDNFWG